MAIQEPPSESAALREQLERLLAGGEASAGGAESIDFREWRLVGADLSKLDLTGADLSGADLTGADLSDANLAGAQMQGASLCHATLTGCEFLSANLRDADLNHCRAGRAGFGGADLGGARLFEADLSNATLSHANCAEADFRCADLRGARLRAADLSGADACRADLREADLSESSVPRASFAHADLRHARLGDLKGFEKGDWVGADVRDADFRGGYHLRRFILDENFLHEFRSRSRASAALYWVWWATSDCGRSAARWGLLSALVVACFAAVYQVVGVDFGEHATPLSPLYYSVITVTTLGYGDVVPNSVAGQVASMLEVIIGYLALGGLISIFATKMSRRAD